MKNTYKIVLLIFLAITIALLYFTDLWNIKYTKTLHYKEYAVEYDQFLNGSKKLWENHYITNEMLYAQANRSLGLRLCETYKTNKSDSLKAKIILLSNTYAYYESQSIDSIMKNASVVFDPNIGIE